MGIASALRARGLLLCLSVCQGSQGRQHAIKDLCLWIWRMGSIVPLSID